jgi:hypothetical protein
MHTSTIKINKINDFNLFFIINWKMSLWYFVTWKSYRVETIFWSYSDFSCFHYHFIFLINHWYSIMVPLHDDARPTIISIFFKCCNFKLLICNETYISKSHSTYPHDMGIVWIEPIKLVFVSWSSNLILKSLSF